MATKSNEAQTGSKALFDMIQQIARHGMMDAKTGAVHGTERTVGYVAKIHDDGELAGTIDVQEFIDYMHQDDIDAKVGYHEGVFLTAMQNNTGLLIKPKLYSEVVIVMDPATNREYVSLFSHVDVIQLDSHDTVTVGVQEREEFEPDDEEGDDVDELKPTGIFTKTEYTKDSIISTVTADKDGNNTVYQEMNGEGLKQVIGDDKSSQTMTQDEIVLKHDKANVTLDDSQAKLEMNKSSVTVEDDTVYVGSKSGTDDAVLGQQLASILSTLVGCIAQMMIPTMMGPQPPANMLGNFISLKAQIQSFASSHSGFLTQKVQIQK